MALATQIGRLRLPTAPRGAPPERARPAGRAAAGLRSYRAGLGAEEAAARLYAAEGGRVVHRRWRCQEGEIDLAVEIGGILVFVEVKARREGLAAAEALQPAQARRLVAAASRYLAERHPDQEARIDVVLVDRFGQTERIENALVAA